MGRISRVKEAWRIRKAYREGKRFKVMKPITQSRTTATVAGATGTTSGLVFAFLTFLRGRTDLPWEPEGDAAIVAVVTTILAPLLSRLIAKYRKGGDTIKPAALGFLICGVAALLGGCVLAGCMTTQVLGPDGTILEVRRQVDRDLLDRVATLAKDPELYEQAWELYKRIAAYRSDLRTAEGKTEREELEARIAAAQRAIEGLVATAQAVGGGAG